MTAPVTTHQYTAVPPSIRWRITQRPESWDRDHLTQQAAAAIDPRLARFTWLDQVHGTTVVRVEAPGKLRGAVADAAVTTVPGAVLVVRCADCAPILLHGTQPSTGAGVLGVAHGGWRGLLDGVLDQTVAAIQQSGASQVTGWLGPCIGPECYQFGTELDRIAERFGPTVRGRTRADEPALDLPETVASALSAAGAVFGGLLPGWSCTGCDAARRFSHRARGENGRLALIASLQAGQAGQTGDRS